MIYSLTLLLSLTSCSSKVLDSAGNNSPTGGAIPTYHKFDTTEALRLAIQSDYSLDKVSKSKRFANTNIGDYSAIVIPGGYGQFTDLHQNKQIKKMIVTHYENGGHIGTIGHGTALLSRSHETRKG